MNNFLKQAIELSKNSIEAGGFPVGAIIVKNNKIIGQGLSNGKNNKDATSHAEIEAIRATSLELGTRDLFGCWVYSPMEPCLMCFSAFYWAKLDTVVYALGKDRISKQHYEGACSLLEINAKNNRQIKIIHDKNLEDEALSVVQNWEFALKNS